MLNSFCKNMDNKKSICLIKIKISKAVKLVLAACFFIQGYSSAQLKWVNVDSLFQPLPKSFHVYKTTDSLDDKPFIAYYTEADIKDKKLDFTTDTTYKRRLTPLQFYETNNKQVLVVNGTFFSFQTNQNLNVVIKDGKLVSYNVQAIFDKKDSLYHYITRSAFGISKKRIPDVAWLYNDSSLRRPYRLTFGPSPRSGKISNPRLKDVKWAMPCSFTSMKRKWKMQTAIGGGPVLLQQGGIRITNEEEKMFTGKAIDDKHPRTAMGYTRGNKLIILVVQGRFPGIAEGASLKQEAQILKDLGCWEALNLDGGGSSCMLINGKETIKPSDKEGQRAVPAVFTITNINIP
jgi:hypothetical protein